MRESIAVILRKVSRTKSRDEKIAILREHKSGAIARILQLMYDPKTKFLLPKGKPPYTPSRFLDTEGMMYKETRRLRIFVEGGGYDNLNKIKRESLFISLLEDVDKRDAEMLTLLVSGKKYSGIDIDIINEVYPGLIGVEE